MTVRSIGSVDIRGIIELFILMRVISFQFNAFGDSISRLIILFEIQVQKDVYFSYERIVHDVDFSHLFLLFHFSCMFDCEMFVRTTSCSNICLHIKCVSLHNIH